MEANAFAALLLVPSTALTEKLDVYDIDRRNITLNDIVKLMDIFAVPFKAIVLRILEENILDERAAEQLIQEGTEENLTRSMNRQYVALRWQKRLCDVGVGLLTSLLQQNQEEGRLPDNRIYEDREILHKLIAPYSGK